MLLGNISTTSSDRQSRKGLPEELEVQEASPAESQQNILQREPECKGPAVGKRLYTLGEFYHWITKALVCSEAMRTP